MRCQPKYSSENRYGGPSLRSVVAMFAVVFRVAKLTALNLPSATRALDVKRV